MDGHDQGLEGGFEVEGDDAFVDHVGDVAADHVHAEEFAVFGIEDHFDEAFLVAGGHRFSVGAERAFPDLDFAELFFGFAFSEADAGDFGDGVDGVGDGFVADLVVFAFQDVVGDDDAFVAGRVGELDAAGDIADGGDVVHMGLHGVINDFDAAAVKFDADFFEVHAVGVGFATHTEEDDVHLDFFGLATGGDEALPTVFGLFALVEAGTGFDVDAGSVELFAELFAEVFVEGRYEVGHHFDEGNFRSETVEHVGEFDADGASAEDEHSFGDFGGGDGVVAGPDAVFAAAFQARDVEVDDAGAHREDEVLGGEFLLFAVFVNFDRVLVDEFGEALDVVDLVLFKEIADAASLGLHDFLLAGHHLFEIHGDVAFGDDDAEVTGVFDVVEAFDGSDHGFGGDASPVETGSAEIFLFYNGDFGSELGAADGGDIAAGARSNHNDISIKIFVRHGLFLFLGIENRVDFADQGLGCLGGYGGGVGGLCPGVF